MTHQTVGSQQGSSQRPVFRAPGARAPVVIRPRPLPLVTLENLARSHGSLARRLRSRPDQVRAIARVILRNDPRAQEKFGDADTLTDYLVAALRA